MHKPKYAIEQNYREDYLTAKLTANLSMPDPDTSTTVTTVTTGTFNCQKNLSAPIENICDEQKPVLHAVVAVFVKNSKDNITGDGSYTF
jgi:hypothetical protein